MEDDRINILFSPTPFGSPLGSPLFRVPWRREGGGCESVGGGRVFAREGGICVGVWGCWWV